MTTQAHELGKFEGKTEVASELKITKTGDGLSKPLAAEPRAWRSGARIPVLLWVEIDDITHSPVDKGPGFVRVHHAPTVEAAVLDRVDQTVLDGLMEQQREAVRLWELEQERLKDEAKGALALDGLEKGGPVDGGAPIETNGVSHSVRPEGISDAEWEESARAASVSPIGSKQARKVKD